MPPFFGPKGVGQTVAARATNVASSFMVSQMTAQVSSVIDAQTAPSKAIVVQHVQRHNPVILPEIGTIVDCFNRGLLTRAQAAYGMGGQGANFSTHLDDAASRNASLLWGAAVIAGQQSPDTSFVLGLVAKGYLEADGDRYRAAMRRSGADGGEWSQYLTSLYSFPGVGDLIEARNREFITDDQWTEGLKRNGFGLSWVRAAYEKLADRIPDVGTILIGVNRGKYTVAEASARLKGIGYGIAEDRSAILDQRYAVPGPADLVHFAVKEAFSVDIANRLHLYDEFPEVIMPFMEQQGMGYQLDFNIISDGVERPAGIPDLYWAAHWQPISASQAFDMLHRFRPNRLDRYQRMGVNVTAFGMEDVRSWLRVNDYPPAIRENVAGLSFNPLRLVDIRQAVGFRIRAGYDAAFALQVGPQGVQALQRFDRDWAIEQFLDRGSVRDDAETQVDLAIAAESMRASAPARALERSTVKSQFTAILKGYALGILAEDVARNALTGLGMSAASAVRQLELQRAAVLMANSTAVLRSCRKEYLTGGMSAADASELLRRAGFQNERIEDYLDQWVIERDTVRKAASTAQIENWLARGYITPLNARERFTRLGWQEPEIVALFAEANQRALDIQARLLSTADRNRRRRTSDLEKLRRQAEKNVKDVQRAIKAATPITTLQRWLKESIISRAEFIARMRRAGYSTVNANRYADDALYVKPKAAAAPKQSESAPQTAGANQPAASTAAHGPTPQAIESLRLSLAASAGDRQLVLNTQPERLNVQPEQLHTLPERLGGNNQQGGG